MDKALAPHREYCRSYIDDVVIYSQSWRDHLLHIDSTFRSLREVGLTVNLEKYAFGQNQVKFLGHIVGSSQHSPDPEKGRRLEKPI
ncbi:hypothetical protein AVEN_207087-1 [Araneus ventricosus]|uniref:Reverse transcriptase domain-containing protein n=1 Tax=Araneus ventricosus TaxID=182803 RepID=A0A4Y2TFK5_ARAVE|nr:hypothetical protein AVEN_207087-1 [Araneus ventricosus]